MYDVVISYQNEVEGKAEKINDYLRAEGINVFFASANQQDMVSEKLHVKLYDVYKNQSLLKLLLVSPMYFKSEWTLLEKRMALESCKNDYKRLVIVNYTGKDLPDDLSSFVYIDGEKYAEDQVAAFITERVKSLSEKSGSGQSGSHEEVSGKEEAVSWNNYNHINNGFQVGNNSTVQNINIKMNTKE